MQYLIMSLRDKEQNREFQLELLRLQLKHEREVVYYGAFIAVGVSFIVFGLTLALTVILSEKAVSFPWLLMITLYPIVGGILSFFSIVRLVLLKSVVDKEIEKIKKQFLDW